MTYLERRARFELIVAREDYSRCKKRWRSAETPEDLALKFAKLRKALDHKGRCERLVKHIHQIYYDLIHSDDEKMADSLALVHSDARIRMFEAARVNAELAKQFNLAVTPREQRRAARRIIDSQTDLERAIEEERVAFNDFMRLEHGWSRRNNKCKLL
ncbi:unnamed protein product [Caenorhabditis auriculariae]|uniref:Uncharacterized protein n=1 Tax=Caenorhabditis auriculariae TaxID=2777116 RepID=A0A8S1H192_9PELO|nr:unnamed protein product [Caenorhabditis auriculariae]